MRIGDKIDFDRYTWRVLDMQADRALLLTEDIVGQRAYNNRAGDVTWADCELRAYLNGSFYDAFSEASRARIVKVVNHTPDNPWYGSRGGEDTEDAIFLLSLEETVCRYFGDSSKNLANRSPKQRYWFQRKDANNSKRMASLQGRIWWWWLRSPGRDNRRAIYLHGDGNIGIQGNGTFHYTGNTLHPLTGENFGGIRPALWVRV